MYTLNTLKMSILPPYPSDRSVVLKLNFCTACQSWTIFNLKMSLEHCVHGCDTLKKPMTSISFVYVDQQLKIVSQNIKTWHVIPYFISFSRSVRDYQEQLDFLCFSKIKDFWCTLQTYCNIYNQSSLHSPSRPFIKINQQKLIIQKSSNHKHNNIWPLQQFHINHELDSDKCQFEIQQNIEASQSKLIYI